MLYLSHKLKDFEMQIKYSLQKYNSFFIEKKLVENFYMDLRGPKLMQIPLEDRETYSKYFLSYLALRLAWIILKMFRISKTTNLPLENTFTWVSGKGFVGQEHVSEAQEYLIC